LATANELELDLALERDPDHPPFMRIAQQPKTTTLHPGTANTNDSPSVSRSTFSKFLDQAPKPSLTRLHVFSYEKLCMPRDHRRAAKKEFVSEMDESCGPTMPVTRVSMTPHTGRTHQLRVHAAAIGHPMVGDDIYGVDTAFPENANAPLCLHAQQLCIYHPYSGAPMIFESTPSF